MGRPVMSQDLLYLTQHITIILHVMSVLYNIIIRFHYDIKYDIKYMISYDVNDDDDDDNLIHMYKL